MERRVIFFEDVREGGEVPPFMVERLTRMDLVRYAGASGDFNPIHTDEEFARAAGNPSVFGHGMLTAAFVGKCVTDYVGADNLRRFKVRFATRVWPGDSITCKGKVTKKYEHNGEKRIDGERLALFAESDPALWDRLIAVNFKGALHATHAVVEGMIARGRGRIVSISSDAGRVGSTGEAVYSGCKAALIGFSKALARELARHC